jgi:hypothetical protein
MMVLATAYRPEERYTRVRPWHVEARLHVLLRGVRIERGRSAAACPFELHRGVRSHRPISNVCSQRRIPFESPDADAGSGQLIDPFISVIHCEG